MANTSDVCDKIIKPNIKNPQQSFVKKLTTNHEYLMKWIIYVGVSMLMFGGCAFLTEHLFDHFKIEFDAFASFLPWDAFYAQCSMTFIVVSLIAFLSDGAQDVLWDDTIKYNLVNPKIFNIIGIASYLIGDLLVSLICLLFGKNIAVTLLFVVSILLLICVTYKLIGAFFCKNIIRESMCIKYDNMKENEVERVIDILTEKTLRQINNKEYINVRENIFFLWDHRQAHGVIEYDALLSVLWYLSKNDGGKFFDICEERGILSDIKVREMCYELSMDLLIANRNPDLCYRILKYLFKKPLVAVELPSWEEFDSEGYYMGTTGFNEAVVGEYAKRISNQIKDQPKPLDLLFQAYLNHDMRLVKLIIDYLADECDSVRIDPDQLEFILPGVLSKNVKNWFSGTEYKMDLFSEKDKNIIQKIITIDENVGIIFDDSKKKLESFLELKSCVIP